MKNNTKGRLCVGVPSYRQDVAGEIDLVEEIARVFGYELMPTTLPAIKPQVSVYTSRDSVNRIKDILADLGSSEVITYSLVSRELLKGLESGNLIEILNPLSREQEIMRPTLLPGSWNA